jgi:hypothetical protein
MPVSAKQQGQIFSTRCTPAQDEGPRKRQSVKTQTVSTMGCTSCDVKLLRVISLPTASIQTQNFDSRFADYFPRLLHHICRANSLSLRQWGAQVDDGRHRESSQASKIPRDPFAEKTLRLSYFIRGLCSHWHPATQ